MNWTAFERDAPSLAAIGRQAFDRTGLVLLGTLRRDGWPRISPVEHMFIEDELLLGMMRQSRKARDLLRDPRCVAHASIGNPDGRSDPEFKLYARARDVLDPALRTAYGDAWWARSQWRPSEPYHLFALEITSAGYVRFDEGEITHDETWPPFVTRNIQRRS